MNSNVTCVIQVMSDTRADTYFNALVNMGTQLLGNISKKVTTSTDQICMNNLTSWKNVRQNGMSDLWNAIDQGKETNSKSICAKLFNN